MNIQNKIHKSFKDHMFDFLKESLELKILIVIHLINMLIGMVNWWIFSTFIDGPKYIWLYLLLKLIDLRLQCFLDKYAISIGSSACLKFKELGYKLYDRFTYQSKNDNNINLKITKIYNKNPQKINLKMIKNHNLIEKFINKQIGLIPVVNNKNILQNVITWSEVFKAEKSKSELKKIDVVIMAGGKGERLKPYTDILPKPLIPVNSKPMLEHIIENFEYFHFRKFHLVLNHQAQLIKTYFQSKQKSYKINCIKEAKTLGTIGGLSLVKKISSSISYLFDP